ncbi:aldose 1-epimerase family protein [Streptococcus agalactiae]|uniref:aldose 1-epimerase family protein n=1 Tax=Streptococcus agalactiae TaxID=1311 RepID=UPI000E73C52E|nr:aldose 1-epimerase family protein [Streptococcus agalactiae]RJX45823.1 aldose 1-epimerase family protein [Streptococcus agalactiae]
MVIELTNKELTVQFKEFGGALSSIKDSDGIEYLWQGNPEYWSGQAPVLFPICGSLRNDIGFFKNEDGSFHKGQIPRHGLVRKEVFIFEQISDNSVSFTITPNEYMLENYPYQFELKIIYTLNDKTIRTEYQVTNHEDNKKMPFFIGGHPGFNCPLFDGEQYEDYYLEFEKEETCEVPNAFPETGLLDVQDRTVFLNQQKTIDLDYSLFDYDAITLDDIQSRSVSLRSKKHNKGLTLDFSDFPNLILWSTINKSPFIALEPWSGLSTSLEENDLVESKRKVSFVNPGETVVKLFDITIL